MREATFAQSLLLRKPKTHGAIFWEREAFPSLPDLRAAEFSGADTQATRSHWDPKAPAQSLGRAPQMWNHLEDTLQKQGLILIVSLPSDSQ
jgi:hypothetical protein